MYNDFLQENLGLNNHHKLKYWLRHCMRAYTSVL